MLFARSLERARRHSCENQSQRRPLIMIVKYSEPQHAKETKEEELEKILKDQLSTCPITREPFKIPVMDPDGYTYERSAIVKWVTRNGTSPMTREPLRVHQLIPNRFVMSIIDKLEDLSRSKCERTKKHGTFQVNTRSMLST
jgi:hypothetical protein